LKTVSFLIAILIILQSVSLYHQTRVSYVEDTTFEVKTVEFLLSGDHQGWNNAKVKYSFNKPVFLIGASLISCVSSSQGLEVFVSHGIYDFSKDTFSDDTLFHLSSVYSQMGGLATATVMLPRGYYYYIESDEVLNIDVFLNDEADGGSILLYYVELKH
jgi:hypothetical protein